MGDWNKFDQQRNRSWGQARQQPTATPPTPPGGPDYDEMRKQQAAQLEAQRKQMELLQKQADAQKKQFEQLLKLEQERARKLEVANTEQSNLFSRLKTEQDAALKLQEARLQRSQGQALEEQQALFRLGQRTSNMATARNVARRTQIGAVANVFRS